jgi:serpin B
MRSPRLAIVILAAWLVAAAGCGDGLGPSGDPGEPTAPERLTELPRALTAAEVSVIAASNDFGIELVRAVAALDAGPNVILSPLSASMALGMTLNGADGATFDGMRSALGFGTLDQDEINASYRALIDLLSDLDPAVTLEIANAIWSNQDFPFHDTFFEAVAAAFDAAAQSRDFDDPGVVDEINDWVSENTDGLIDSIVESLTPDMVMLLLNAIYLDAEWTQQFDPDETRPRPFIREDGSTVTVDMMKRTESLVVPSVQRPEYTAVELAYGAQAYSMVVVLPAPGVTVRELLADLDATAWNALLEDLHETEWTSIEIPKFTLEYDGGLNDALIDMGMGNAFDPGGADFTRMSPAGDELFISSVRQKTFMEVDEVGTRAAAVTVVVISTTSFQETPKFVADRPFLLAIRERLSGTLLFAGLVGDPTAG